MGVLIQFGLTGLLIIFLSYLIKYKKQANLISGYDEDMVIDKDGYCNWFGGTLVWAGVYAIVTGVLLWLWPAWFTWIVLSFGVCVIALVIVAIVGGRKFKKQR
ncbi:DUF3784 domain-containing protein [Mucilaginibacter sp.]|uniref:DUF3784 domain-containing protein n=1 Tax=Mucilaginibacter sp. TaxID=1882438 RepID=UPI003D0FE765